MYTWRGRATRATQLTPYGLLRDLFARRFGILDSDSAAQALARFRQGMAGILEGSQADLAGHLAGFDFSSSPPVRALRRSPEFGQIAAAALRQALHALWRLPVKETRARAAPGTGSGQGKSDANGGEDPALLLLEDLHWADDASLDLIAGLVSESPRGRLLVVAAARPELLERRPSWGEGQEAYSRLELRPLSRRNSRALVGEILQRVAEVPEELAERLVEGAEGNPFFLEELVKMLIEDGAIEPGAEQWRVVGARVGQVRLPPTLTAVLQARLDALPPDQRLVLQRASVVGRQFWDSLVAELAPEVADVGPVLAALRARELVFKHEQSAFAGVQEYTFKHAILREVTYESVRLQVRRQCHAQVAAWLESRAGQRLGEYTSLVAAHYRLAGRNREAADWYMEAGERAASLGANGEARGFFDTALELAPPSDLERRWRCLAGRDAVLGVLGEREAREADDAALLALARAIGDDDRLAEAHYRRGHYLGVLSRYPEAVEALDAAIERGRPQREHPGSGERTLPESARHGPHGPDRRRVPACRGSPGLRRRPGRAGDTGPHAEQRVAVLRGCRRPCTASQLLTRQTEIMRQAGNLVGQAISLGNLGYSYLLLGLYERSRAALEQALDLTGRTGARRERLYDQVNLGLVCWRMGDAETARRLLEEAIAELEALGDTFARASGQNYLGLVLESCCDASAAAAAFSEAQRSLVGDRGAGRRDRRTGRPAALPHGGTQPGGGTRGGRSGVVIRGARRGRHGVPAARLRNLRGRV